MVLLVGFKGVLKGDLKGLERAEELERRRRLSGGVGDMVSLLVAAQKSDSASSHSLAFVIGSRLSAVEYRDLSEPCWQVPPALVERSRCFHAWIGPQQKFSERFAVVAIAWAVRLWLDEVL